MPQVMRRIFNDSVLHVTCLQHVKKNISDNAWRINGFDAQQRRHVLYTLKKWLLFSAVLPGD
eukprot:1633899-Karenia_brevis.AAC.1